MQTIYRQLLATVFTALLSISMVHAAEPPMPDNTPLAPGYPLSFPARGIVGQVSSTSLTVDGTRYRVAISAMVHSLSGDRASLLDLRSGSEIGFSFERQANNRRTITEIWILPQGSIKPS
ncbi:MAG: hypothetical protein RRB22_11705 [Gammaproteobacteria bacterium]|nr:hypothetical protein [Gammaproteobacteria bacterium]